MDLSNWCYFDVQAYPAPMVFAQRRCEPNITTVATDPTTELTTPTTSTSTLNPSTDPSTTSSPTSTVQTTPTTSTSTNPRTTSIGPTSAANHVFASLCVLVINVIALSLIS